MNGILFLYSPYLRCPNVLIDFDCHYSRKKFIIDAMRFSKTVSIQDGVHICDPDLLNALIKVIRKDCQICRIYFANEETKKIEILS